MKYTGWLEAFEDASEYDEENPLEDQDSEDGYGNYGDYDNNDADNAADRPSDPSRGLTVVNPTGYRAKSNSKVVISKTAEGIKVFIPALDPALYEYLVSIIKQELADQQYSKKEIKQLVPEYFSKVGNNTYMVNYSMWASIQIALEEAGYGMEWAAEQKTEPKPEDTPEEPESSEEAPEASSEAPEQSNLPKITNVRTEGDMILFSIGEPRFPLEKTKKERMLAFLYTQGLWPKYIRWYDPEKTSIAILDRTKYITTGNQVSIKDVLEQFLDTSQLDAVALEKIDPKQLKFQNLEGKKTLIYFPGYYNSDDRTVDNYKQMLKCIFPGAEFHEGQRRGYIVSGSVNQYAVWLRIMNRYGFKDVSEWKNIINEKYRRGDFDGETLENPKIKPEFLEKVDRELTGSEIKLYTQQKEGVGFLYHKNSAILGDECGLGKTAQLIAAADMKMRDSSLKGTLIFTVNAAKYQWAEEIQKVLGEGQREKIAVFNPPAGKKKQDAVINFQPKQWTIIHYDAFSQGKNIEKIKDSLKNYGFGIVIFDELHKMKGHTAKRSANISEVVEHIPIRWGATATLAANAPIDVQNQVSMIGHFLGKIERRRFSSDFAAEDKKRRGCECKIDARKNPIRCPKCGKPTFIYRQSQMRPECEHEFNRYHKDLNPHGRRTCPVCRKPAYAAYREGCWHKYPRDQIEKCPDCGKPNWIKAEKEQIEAAERLNKWLHLTGVYIRRSKDELKKMPDKTNDPYIAKIDPDYYRQQLVRALNGVTDPLAILEKTRIVVAKSKVDATVARAYELVKQGKKVLVFTCFIEPAKMLAEKFSRIGPTLTYIGSTSKKDRSEVRQKFMYDPRYPILVMSMRMGGTGLSFPNVYDTNGKPMPVHMLINDYDWTPELSEQSEGRIYRIDTELPVNIEYMIAPGVDGESFDEFLYQRVQKKRDLAAVVQKYRKNYEEDIDPEKALQQVVDGRVEIDKLSRQIIVAATKEAQKVTPKTEDFSFKDFIDKMTDIDNLYVYAEVEDEF